MAKPHSSDGVAVESIVVSKFRFALGMLVATGGVAAAAGASAATETYDFSGFTPTQSVEILGQSQYEYGASSGAPKSFFTPASGSTALIGSYSNTPSNPSSDSYASVPVKTNSSIFGPAYESDSYANLKFFVDGKTYLGTANFVRTGDDVVLHTIDYTPTAVPEPESWALLVAGVGLAGAALRRNRGQAAATAQ
jgi:hypothetical protein